jgi:hypothetical protein
MSPAAVELHGGWVKNRERPFFARIANRSNSYDTPPNSDGEHFYVIFVPKETCLWLWPSRTYPNPTSFLFFFAVIDTKHQGLRDDKIP